MNTPIIDFVSKYKNSNNLRFHMPGHKGKKTFIGIEEFDITEIHGADSLFEADGIIKESERNAGTIFGAETFFSAEGSSLCIRAMLYLAICDAKEKGRNLTVIAGRNAHKTFFTAAALLDFEVEWLYNDCNSSYLSCEFDLFELERKIKKENPAAVYITSPDYLGNISNISEISKICKKYNTLLVVDNAHGAYLKFLPNSLHPIDLGADMCCDSAHKTLPALTGGAYMHLSESVEMNLKDMAKNAMSLFASTSPSYLILESLDYVNFYIDSGYKEKLNEFCLKVEKLKNNLFNKGYSLIGSEPLKITIETKPYGYTGIEFDELISKKGIVCEFCDPDFVVFMLVPELSGDELEYLEDVLINIPRKEPITCNPPFITCGEKIINIREAVFSSKVELMVDNCVGKILANVSISCPPAVPVLVCGEKITKEAVECFRYYGIEKCFVVKE